jgi:hypothetical protein
LPSIASWLTLGRLAVLTGLALCLSACPAVQNSGNSAGVADAGGLSAQSTSASDPLVIAGTPPTSVSAGQTYSFQPTASDSAAEPLTFSIVNSPAWSTFDTATGLLSGTPGSAQTGTYADITISVSDATGSVSLPAFSITVDTSPPGTATLVWTAPTQNTDGTPLTNLAGYHVHYGTDASLADTIDVGDPTATTYVVDGLSAGTYYFAVSAYNSFGVEGARSNVASKTL